ncbi:hypothetical protein NSQ54_10345 [Alkalihalobacillus sp. FSL W8-0930]
MKLPEVTPFTTDTAAYADDFNKRQNELKERDEKIADQLRSQDAITAPLKHGLNLVESEQPGPVDFLITGQTRVNLLPNFLSERWVRHSGKWETTAHSIKIMPEGDWQMQYFKLKLKANKPYLLNCLTNGRVQIRKDGFNGTTIHEATPTVRGGIPVQSKILFISNGENELYLRIDTAQLKELISFEKITLFELTQSEYSEALLLTESKLGERYPFIEGVQHVRNPVVVKKGKNLLPAFPDSFTSRLETKDIISLMPYELKFISNGTDQFARFHIPAVPNQVYTLQCDVETDGTNNGVIAYHKNAASNDESAYVSTGASRGTFKTLPGTKYLEIRLSSLSTPGTYSFTNFSLTIGSRMISFQPQNNDYLYFSDTLLGSSSDGTVRDSIYKKNGNYVSIQRMKSGMIDGSKSMRVMEEGIGFKRIKPVDFSLFQEAKGSTPNVFAHDTNSGSVYSDKDQNKPFSALFHNDSSFSITIPNERTGFVDGVTPTNEQVNNFFRDNPFLVHYELAVPIERSLSEEGEISLHGGSNLIEIEEGIITKEIVNPVRASGEFLINQKSVSDGASKLKYRDKYIVGVYRDGVLDKKWNISNNHVNSAGTQLARIPVSEYDEQSTYTVTYIVLDKHTLTTTLSKASVTYQSSFKSAFEKEVERNTDTKQQVTAHELMLAEVVKLVRQLKGV